MSPSDLYRVVTFGGSKHRDSNKRWPAPPQDQVDQAPILVPDLWEGTFNLVETPLSK